MRYMCNFEGRARIADLDKENFVLCCGLNQKEKKEHLEKNIKLDCPITTDNVIIGNFYELLAVHRDLVFLGDYSPILRSPSSIASSYGMERILNKNREKVVDIKKYKHRSFIFINNIFELKGQVFMSYFTAPPSLLTANLNSFIRKIIIDDILDEL